MPRSVDEWVGNNDDTPIPARVKDRLLTMANGHCQRCGTTLRGQGKIFDHKTALINWLPTNDKPHGNRESNIWVIGEKCCNKAKTALDVKIKSIAAKKRKSLNGLKSTRNPVPGSKASRFKKRMDGTVIDRETGKVIGGASR